MKTLPVESTGPKLRTLLPMIAEEEAVFLTIEGQVRFVVLAADEDDQEFLAMRGNRRLMEFLDHCGERARTGPRKSLAALRQETQTRKPRHVSGPKRANGKSGRSAKRKK